MILAAIAIWVGPEVAPATDSLRTPAELYRSCIGEFQDGHLRDLDGLTCEIFALAGYSRARQRDEAANRQSLCVPTPQRLRDGAEKLRLWLRSNPDRAGDVADIAADAMIASYPCPHESEEQ